MKSKERAERDARQVAAEYTYPSKDGTEWFRTLSWVESGDPAGLNGGQLDTLLPLTRLLVAQEETGRAQGFEDGATTAPMLGEDGKAAWWVGIHSWLDIKSVHAAGVAAGALGLTVALKERDEAGLAATKLHRRMTAALKERDEARLTATKLHRRIQADEGALVRLERAEKRYSETWRRIAQNTRRRAATWANRIETIRELLRFVGAQLPVVHGPPWPILYGSVECRLIADLACRRDEAMASAKENFDLRISMTEDQERDLMAAEAEAAKLRIALRSMARRVSSSAWHNETACHECDAPIDAPYDEDTEDGPPHAASCEIGRALAEVRMLLGGSLR